MCNYKEIGPMSYKSKKLKIKELNNSNVDSAKNNFEMMFPDEHIEVNPEIQQVEIFFKDGKDLPNETIRDMLKMTTFTLLSIE